MLGYKHRIRVVEIEKESEQVLVKYHCGVWY